MNRSLESMEQALPNRQRLLFETAAVFFPVALPG